MTDKGRTQTKVVNRTTSHITASPAAILILTNNRRYGIVENGCHSVIDWNWDEDRCTVHIGHGPENPNLARLPAAKRQCGLSIPGGSRLSGDNGLALLSA